LLLTAFRRPDTGFNATYRVGRRVFFTASANVGYCVGGTNNGGTCTTDNGCAGSPPGRCNGGKNPSENCQLFSADTLGGNLRQLTDFRERIDRSEIGCNFGGPPGCLLDARFDRKTRTALLYSDCNPPSTNSNPDGTI